MELITVKAPLDSGEKMAAIAFELGIVQVEILKGRALRKDKPHIELDILEFETDSLKAKKFLERLMESSFYDPDTFHFSTHLPASVFGSERPEEETLPFVRPTTDVYQELWQTLRLTHSLGLRIFLAAFLMAYGMKIAFMPLIIAGLLFLPYHHHLLGISLGAVLREVNLLRQALLSFFLASLLIVAGGAVVGLLATPGIKFLEFAELPLLFSFLISVAIGVAAGLATTDEAGDKELIGLAATAHVSVYPGWFGLKLIHGFEVNDKPWELLFTFGIILFTILFFAALTFQLVGMKGSGIRNFVKAKEKGKGR